MPLILLLTLGKSEFIPQFVTGVPIPSAVSCPGHKKTGCNIDGLVRDAANRSAHLVLHAVFTIFV